MENDNPRISRAKIRAELTPADAYEGLNKGGPGLILDSARNGNRSYVCLEPLLEFRSKGDRIEIIERGRKTEKKGNPFEELERIAAEQKGGLGLFGYFGYEAGRFIEKLPGRVRREIDVPDSYFIIPGKLIEFDHGKGSLEVLELEGNAAETAGRIGKIKAAKEGMPKGKKQIELEKDFTREEYMAAVRKAKDYIFAGDAFQIVLTQHFKAKTAKNPMRIYRILRQINPSPFAAYLDAGDFQLVSCSPERLVMVKGRHVETRPIAGTYPREKTISKELLKDIKERAEHVMLVDLERNDLGRVCVPGTVEVDDMMRIEEYSHVMHIVSTIKGELLPGKNAFDALKACFPGGTITGCPKVRAMEIIDELEKIERGPYTGSLGYFRPNGDADFNIMIRTMVVKDGTAHIQCGGGIVADSMPEKEYEETLHKARALIEALEAAEAEDDNSN